MAIASTALAMMVDRKFTDRILKLVFSGNYATNGDTLDLTAITEAGIDGAKFFSRLPIYGYEMNASGGYYVEVIPGTTLKNWKVKVYSPGGTELGAGGYPGALTSPTSPFIIGVATVTGV